MLICTDIVLRVIFS